MVSSFSEEKEAKSGLSAECEGLLLKVRIALKAKTVDTFKADNQADFSYLVGENNNY